MHTPEAIFTYIIVIVGLLWVTAQMDRKHAKQQKAEPSPVTVLPQLNGVPMEPLTEDRMRQIIREELTRVLHAAPENEPSTREAAALAAKRLRAVSQYAATMDPIYRAHFESGIELLELIGARGGTAFAAVREKA